MADAKDTRRCGHRAVVLAVAGWIRRTKPTQRATFAAHARWLASRHAVTAARVLTGVRLRIWHATGSTSGRSRILVTDVENPVGHVPDGSQSNTRGWIPCHTTTLRPCRITVADLDTVTAFFVGLGLEVEGMFVEGEFLDTVIGSPLPTEIVMLRPPDGGTGWSCRASSGPTTSRVTAAMANELGLRNVAFEVDDLQARRPADRGRLRAGRRHRPVRAHLAHGLRARTGGDHRVPGRADRLTPPSMLDQPDVRRRDAPAVPMVTRTRSAGPDPTDAARVGSWTDPPRLSFTFRLVRVVPQHHRADKAVGPRTIGQPPISIELFMFAP